VRREIRRTAGYHAKVIRVLPVFAALLAGLLTFIGSGAQAAAPAQSLGVVLHRSHAATERLPHYRSGQPIAVHVEGREAARLPALTMTASGPNGASLSAPMVRSGNAFTANLPLSPGTWNVAFSAQLGTITAALANVPLDVESEDGDLAARIAFGFSALSIVAGLLLVLRWNGRPLLLNYATKRS
jgi:hypothetical protein